MDKPIVGVLALQGDFREHVVAVKRAMNNPNYPVTLVKTVEDILPITHLIIPGGESTVMNKLSMVHQSEDNLRKMILKKYEEGMKILGTCAGVILISTKIEGNSENDPFEGLGLIDISTARNAYGRQVDSFEAKLKIKDINPVEFHGVFIRAPQILSVNSPDVEILAKHNERIVMVKNQQILAMVFHPELTEDYRIHEYFLAM
ncbi:MAG: pyridoxal 5'-phosphate synthase glutaminase subunit PdxT [Asgard group archaeon]|nr:pyridoxal 5'-phosphate synthase glutaminase subunit PdxT [Asgard group archaeon]